VLGSNRIPYLHFTLSCGGRCVASHSDEGWLPIQADRAQQHVME
jgi:hypothetical protein